MTEFSIDLDQVYLQVTAMKPDHYEALSSQIPSNWLITDEAEYKCFFDEKAYHCILNSPNTYRINFAEDLRLDNFALQVEMAVLEGNGGGIVFRADIQDTWGYRLFFGRPYIDLMYHDKWLFHSPGKYIPHLDKYYEITVIAENTNIILYIDGQSILHKCDDSASFGKTGFLVVHFAGYNATHVTFRNLRIWKNLPNFQIL